ncbi:MAG: TauD/TfdA family dioxygenase [Anaerolineae bacterium]|nr:TauD/TfdA family dioxygenase [Anaerolineae bacterium]
MDEALLRASTLQVKPELAQALLEAVHTLPDFEYYALVDSPEQQQQILADVMKQVPELSTLAKAIRDGATQRPYFLWVKGVALDERCLVLIALSLALGNLRRHHGTLAQDTLPNSAEVVKLKPAFYSERMHTDGMHWLQPNDLTCIYCVKPDQNQGGESLVIDVDTILEMIEPDEAMRHVLREVAIPFTTSFDDRVETHYHRIIDEDNRLRWYLKNIEAAINWGEGEIDPAHLKVLRQFEDLVESTTNRFQFMLQPGDLLIVNNRKSLHGRTDIRNPLESERTLVRTRLTLAELDA